MSGRRSIRAAAGPPSAVRVRLSCPSLEAYQARLAAHHALEGIFIPSGRSLPRPVGSRVQLKIELGDRTLAYTGGAVVVALADAHRRPGLVLSLDKVESTPAPRWAWPSDEIFADLDLGPDARLEPERANAPADLEEVEAELIEPGAPEDSPDPAGPADAADLEEVEAELIEPRPPEDRPGAAWPPDARPPEHLVARARAALAALPEWTSPPPQALRPPPPHRRGRAVAAVLVAAVALPGLAGGAALLRLQRRSAADGEAAFSRCIQLADDRLVAARLALPRGDSALDHLLAARTLRSDDARATARLAMLADTFEALAARALLRGDLEEAAAHLAGALRADPRRDRARAELEGVESRRRARPPPQPLAAGQGWGASG